MTKKTIRVMLWLSAILIAANILFNLSFWVILPENYKHDGSINFIVFLANQEVMLILLGLPLLILNIILTIFIIPLIGGSYESQKTTHKIFWKILIFPLTIITLGLSTLLIIIFILKKTK